MGIDNTELWTDQEHSDAEELLDHYDPNQYRYDSKKCLECGGMFVLTEGEIHYYLQRGLMPPKRCKPCRAERKANAQEMTQKAVQPEPQIRSEQYERVSIVCDHCGRSADVPFKPFAGRSVYCKVCWVGIKNIGARINYILS